MSSIRDTALSTLPERHHRHANAAITALEDREVEIVDTLLDYAAQKKANVDEVKDLLTGLGMDVPDDDDSTRLGRIESKVTSLVDFARRHGFRG